MSAITKQLKYIMGLGLVAVLAACGGAGSGDDGVPDDGNNGAPGTPLSISINAEPATVEVGEAVTLTATIGGEGAEAANVSWEADEGTLSPDNGLEVTWTAPASEGSYSITATLTAAGEPATDVVDLVVTAAGAGPGNGGPGDGDSDEPEALTISITPEVSTVHYAQVIGLSADVDGDGASEATVNWSADNGSFSAPTGPTTNWTAPTSVGPVKITATVAGAVASDSITVDVLCTSGSVADQTDPCMITIVQQLQAIADYQSGHFALGNDVNAAETGNWNAGAGFEPIGNFTGTLNGRDFAISDLYVNKPDEDEVGLFSSIGSGGVVTNLILSDVVIIGSNFVGGLAGSSFGTIYGSRTSGEVSGEDFIGGLVGSNGGGIDASSSSAVVHGDENVGGLVGTNFRAGTIRDSFSNNHLADGPGVTATGQSTGGLVGDNTGIITDSYSGSSVQSTFSSTGGIAGSNWGRIERTYSSLEAVVKGSRAVGGLAGTNWGDIVQSYSLASSVDGSNIVGGLVGHHGIRFHDGVPMATSIHESYSMSQVTGRNDVGGLVGESADESTVTDSYWAWQRSGQNYSAGGYRRETTLMLQRTTFINWDFNADWSIEEGNSSPDLRSNPRP